LSTRESKSEREEIQKAFRRGNERLQQALAGSVSDDRRVPFLCECASEECDSRVEVSPRDWRSIAEQPYRYLLVPEHLLSEGEAVVGYLGEYEVVEKPA
jgi:hypothetical protein